MMLNITAPLWSDFQRCYWGHSDLWPCLWSSLPSSFCLQNSEWAQQWASGLVYFHSLCWVLRLFQSGNSRPLVLKFFPDRTTSLKISFLLGFWFFWFPFSVTLFTHLLNRFEWSSNVLVFFLLLSTAWPLGSVFWEIPLTRLYSFALSFFISSMMFQFP